MAFATRSLRVLCKIYNGTATVGYSTFRQPIHRASLIQVAHRFCSSHQPPSRSRITDSLTNIQSVPGPGPLQTHQNLDTKSNKEEDEKEAEEERLRMEATSKRLRLSFVFIGVFVSIGVSYLIFMATRPDYDEDGNVIPDEFSHLPWYTQMSKKLKRELDLYVKFVQEPSRDKLLPDPLKYPYIQPPYTLVLEMTDLLVHPDWTYQTGWRWKKRPGVDKFLEAIAPPQFEVVVYTAEQGMTVFPILDGLDPNGYIMYRLVRDSTRFIDGHHVKDLDCLNRDLNKVIVIDWNSHSTKLHPENTLKIPRWTGNDDDTTLIDLAIFLRTILASNVEDVRDVLRYYMQFENPLEVFRENQRKLLTQMEEEKQMKAHESRTALTSKWKRSFQG